MRQFNRSIYAAIGTGVAAAVIVAFLVFYGFSSTKQSQPIAGPTTNQTTNVRLGYLDLPAALPVFVAENNGLFKKHGVNVNLISFKTADTSADALLSGQVNAIYVGSSSVLFAIEQDSPGEFKIFQVQSLSPSNPGTDLVVKKGSPITDPSQLAGKKVAIFPSSTAKVLSQLVFEKILGKTPNVNLIEVSPLNWADSLAANAVDAVLAYEPFGSYIVADGIGKIIVVEPFGQYVMHNIPLALASFSTSFVDKNPGAAKAVADSLDESVDYIKKNPTEAKRAFLNYSKIVTERTLPITPVLTNWVPVTNDTAKTLQQLADLLYAKGVYSKRISVSDMLYSPPKGP